MMESNPEVLRHIADNIEADRYIFDGIEQWSCVDKKWVDKKSPYLVIGGNYRIKPATITVNGFEVPAPLSSVGSQIPAYMADVNSADGVTRCYVKVDSFRLAIRRGLMHSTAKAASTHAAAMLGMTMEEMLATNKD